MREYGRENTRASARGGSRSSISRMRAISRWSATINSECSSSMARFTTSRTSAASCRRTSSSLRTPIRRSFSTAIGGGGSKGCYSASTGCLPSRYGTKRNGCSSRPATAPAKSRSISGMTDAPCISHRRSMRYSRSSPAFRRSIHTRSTPFSSIRRCRRRSACSREFASCCPRTH